MHAHARVYAILQALFVTLLWSSSWVLIKVGLKAQMPPLTFAGLRYTLAALVLLPLAVANSGRRRALRAASAGTWVRLCALGLLLYTVTQGAQFIGLALLPAATLSLLLNITPVVVAGLSSTVNREPLAPLQWGGVAFVTAGVLIYFVPSRVATAELAGIVVGLIALGANAASSLLGRQVNRDRSLSPVMVTSVSMGIGGAVLLAAGLSVQGVGLLGPLQWSIVAWMALVNTAFAFTLWNRTLRRLTAVESSTINGAMLPQVAVMAWVLLGESLSLLRIAALGLLTAGTLVVQLAPKHGSDRRRAEL